VQVPETLDSELPGVFRCTIHINPLDRRGGADRTRRGLQYSSWARVYNQTNTLKVILEVQVVKNTKWDIYDFLTTETGYTGNQYGTLTIGGTGAALRGHDSLDEAQQHRLAVTAPDIAHFTVTFSPGLRNLGTATSPSPGKPPEADTKVCSALKHLKARTWYKARVAEVFCPWLKADFYNPEQPLNVYVRLVNSFTEEVLQSVNKTEETRRKTDISALGLTQTCVLTQADLDAADRQQEGQQAHAEYNFQADCTARRAGPKPILACLARTTSCRRQPDERSAKRACLEQNEDKSKKRNIDQLSDRSIPFLGRVRGSGNLEGLPEPEIPVDRDALGDPPGTSFVPLKVGTLDRYRHFTPKDLPYDQQELFRGWVDPLNPGTPFSPVKTDPKIPPHKLDVLVGDTTVGNLFINDPTDDPWLVQRTDQWGNIIQTDSGDEGPRFSDDSDTLSLGSLSSLGSLGSLGDDDITDINADIANLDDFDEFEDYLNEDGRVAPTCGGE